MSDFTRPTPNQRSAYRQSFVISDDKFTPLYVLSEQERQAPGALVSAMGLLQCGEYELLIAGEHDSPDSILVNTRYLGAAGNIDQLYAACDITLALTNTESANQSIVKSLLCGTPVLISITSGIAELLLEKDGSALDYIT
ncbi:MAG: glycosyltransferase, partial [candidate division Zixibacteria bacterium]|nr:glycosyltransferase [candidate division Zixibacteria bacterium]